MAAPLAKNPRMTHIATARALTEADRQAAARLLSIWKDRKTELGLTQESAAFALGMTQSAVNQYLHGRIALGTDATLRWARLLGVDVHAIRDDLELPTRHEPEPAYVDIQVCGSRHKLRLLVEELIDHGLLLPFALAYIADQDAAGDIRPGDTVLVDTRQTAIVDGRLYSVRIDGHRCERVLFRRPGGRVTIAQPGHSHPPFEAPLEAIEVLGRVVFRRGWV